MDSEKIFWQEPQLIEGEVMVSTLHDGSFVPDGFTSQSLSTP